MERQHVLTEALEEAAALQSRGRLEEAARAYEAALALDPSRVETLNNLGSALATLGRHEEAIVHYQRALAIRPDLAEVHNNLGKALAALERHPRSLEHFRRAVALEPTFAEAHNNLGDALEKLDHHAEALASYRNALALDPKLADAHAGLGRVLRTLGRIQEARAALEKAVALAPQRTDFFHALGESKRFTSDDPHLAVIESLNKESLGAEERMMLHFGLAKAYADLDRQTDAFQHLLEANRLKRRTLVYDEQATLGLLERVARLFTADLLRAKAGAGEPSAVPVFIIGMPRSGSTLIEQILASHPGVFGAGETMAFKAAATSARVVPGESFPDGVASWTDEHLRRVGAAYLRTIRTLQPTAERITDKELGNFVYAGLIHLRCPMRGSFIAAALRSTPVSPAFRNYSWGSCPTPTILPNLAAITGLTRP